jgi:hypothetical protein
MKKLMIVIIAGYFILASACNGGSSDRENAVYDMVAPASPALSAKMGEAAEQSSGEQATIERKVIKTANLRFRTGDIDKTRAAVEAAIARTGGYITTENNNNSDYSHEQYLEIKVPANKLDSFIQDISATAKDWETKSISATDVTEEFIDVTARLNTKKELEARYLDLLKRANSVSDIMQVEAQLANVRGEIESMEGRLKYLNSQVSYSTVSLSYYVLVRGPVGFFGRMGEGFVDGWRALLEFAIGMMRAWPFVIIFGGLAWWIGKKWRNRRQLKHTS